MIRTSTAIWHGEALHGTGVLSTQSGVLRDQPYSFTTRFVSEDGRAGTNPEELLGAAHAGCYAMALSYALASEGHPPARLSVTASVDVIKVDDGFSIRSIALAVEATVTGIADDRFQALADAAKRGCTISKALAATPITLDARRVTP